MGGIVAAEPLTPLIPALFSALLAREEDEEVEEDDLKAGRAYDHAVP